MSTYSDQLDAIVAAVNAAALEDGTGQPIAATRDPVELVAGKVGVLVTVDQLDFTILCGQGLPLVQARLVGVAADPSMSALLELVDEVAGIVGADHAQAATWTPPGADPLPCFLLTAT